MNLPIQTQRLLITALEESMAESLHIHSLDADNRLFVPDEVFETVDAAWDAIVTLKTFYAMKDAPQVYAILLRDGRHIGHVQAVPIKKGFEIGYHIGKAHTGNGYATEAVNAFVEPVMGRLGISRMLGICHADNLASRRVLEKCGFTPDFCGENEYHGGRHAICRYVYSR